MEWQIIVALVVAIPVILLPVVLVWYLNLGSVFATIREARARRFARRKQVRIEAEAKTR